MRISLHGGFGERGRICIGLAGDASRVLLDCGVDTSRSGPDRYPAIAPRELAALDAILVTHAHEDHVAALGWCIANGFKGRILMTAETRAAAPGIWQGYAEPDHAALALAAAIEQLPHNGAATIGPLTVTTGRSGHIVGGVWLHVDDGRLAILHCGDLVPASPVFAYDAPPPARVVLLDGSYGDDAVGWGERAAAIVRWIADQGGRAILPAPLSGRSLELLALLGPPVAIHQGMRAALGAQIAADAWLRPGIATDLTRRLAAAVDWAESQPLPPLPLIVHDGMGLSGPSRTALAAAAATDAPVLLTGHVPEGSPAHALRAARKAHWIRLPTHPTLAETQAILAACEPALVLAHSAEPDTLGKLAAHVPQLNLGPRTPDQIAIV